jgi:type VI secretion system protein ImpA
MDVNALLEARTGEGPSGDNLEYDFDFMQLQILAQPGEERQAGSEILAAQEPDHREVETAAMAVLERSHDLRAAVILAAAILNTKGLAGFVEVLAYIRGCLEQYWDTCYPQLDADDDNDPTMRINALQGLSDREGVMAGSCPVAVALRKAPLTNSRNFGRLGLRDLLIASGELAAVDGQGSVDQTTVSAAFADTGDEANARTLEVIKQAQGHVKAIEAVFASQTPGYGPDLDGLRRMLHQMGRFVADYAGAPAADDGDAIDLDDLEVDETPVARRGGGGGAMTGSIETAHDARAALDKVIAYFNRHEPSSPVPIILERAKRLVGADFMTIMKDMAPKGLDSVRMISGIDDQDD